MWQSLIAHLRTLYFTYQFAHWKSQGEQYYGDHLLFQRLYEDMLPEIDQVAEKAIGVSGNTNEINIKDDVKQVVELIDELVDEEDFVGSCVKLEKKLIELIAKAMKEDLSDGVQDMLQAISSKAEEHLYLLQQRSKNAGLIKTLQKTADYLDRKKVFSEADRIDAMIKSIAERAGLKLDELRGLSDKLDKMGAFDLASELDKLM
jgi:DNA-binding ferritin-like protein